jgi:hypothetical protein
MSADYIGEPVTQYENDVPGRLGAIEHHLQQISARLESIGEWKSRLEEIDANLQVLIEIVVSDPKECQY